MADDRFQRRPACHSAKRNRTFKRPYDAELCKQRNIIERFFNKLEQFRRVATRYDELLANLMSFVKLAAIAIWLK
jgi:putative transposase